MQSSTRKSRGGAPDTSGVTRVLHTAGAPLDRSVRSALEPRFGHDFSSVRVHSDPAAADIRARAWTHADHIAFAPGAYAPQTRDGFRLLAHELTHVVQQRGGQTSSTGNAAEVEASTVASAVARGENARVRQQGAAVQYQFDEMEYDPWPEKTEAARIRAEMPLYLEWRGTHPAGFELSKEEKETAEKATGTKAPAKTASAAGLEPKFVLHDTDSSMTNKHFKKQIGMKGPQGAGAAAWVPHPKLEPKKDPELDPVVARDFFEPKRPTTTGFEKGEDIISESKREARSPIIWNASAPVERAPALDRALADTGLSDQDAKDIKGATRTFLEKGGTPKVDGVKTTAAWAVAEICKRVGTDGSEAIADPDAKKHKKAVADLDKNCDETMTKWIESRKRIGERVNVEIAQFGEGKDLPNPPYGSTQYEGVANLYLKAALAALRWPFITTHRWEDRGIIGGHDDPRCFDLDNLYGIITKKMSHPTGTIYGLVPKYGGASDPDANISWTVGQCHGKSPSQKAAEAKAKEEKKAGTTR